MPNWTPQQERDFNARMYGVKQKKCADPVEREADLHGQIQDECRRRGWMAIHSRMDCRNTATVGTPDFIILTGKRYVLGLIYPPAVFFIECKAKGQKPTVEQLSLHAMAEKLGHEVHVVFSLAEFMEITKGLK